MSYPRATSQRITERRCALAAAAHAAHLKTRERGQSMQRACYAPCSRAAQFVQAHVEVRKRGVASLPKRCSDANPADALDVVVGNVEVRQEREGGEEGSERAGSC
eukprot:2169563-Rhodomonas_salina.1